MSVALRRWWPALLLAGTVAAGACGRDTSAAGGSAIRFLAIQGASGPGQALVEYQAPPLSIRRSMPVGTADSTMDVLLRDGTGGGFFAVRFAGTMWGGGGSWELVRFDAGWHLAAARTAAQLLDTVAAAAPPYLELTPDGRYLLASFFTLPNFELVLLALDRATLAPVSRTPVFLPPFYTGAPSAATGSQVLLAAPTGTAFCPSPVVWLDAATGAVTDSASVPCGFALRGALTHRQLYLRGPQSSQTPQDELYDVAAGATIATAGTVQVGLMRYALAAANRLVYLELKDAVVVDPQTLAVSGRIPIGSGADTLRVLLSAIAVDSTGTLAGDTYLPSGCVACNQYADGLVVLDVAKLSVAAVLVVGDALQVVP